MAANTIGLEVIGRLREKYMDLWLATGATDSRLGIGDQMLSIYNAGLDQWHEPELDGSSITTRRARDAGATDCPSLRAGGDRNE
jgi:hypothetical protein